MEGNFAIIPYLEQNVFALWCLFNQAYHLVVSGLVDIKSVYLDQLVANLQADAVRNNDDEGDGESREKVMRESELVVG